MNIFYLDADPDTAARLQYNKHVVKMVLESAQMLCSAHHFYGNGDNVPYKVSHINHPSTIWTRSNTNHYNWLYNHMIALGDEYTNRYKKTHLTIIKCRDELRKPPTGMITSPFMQPPQAMPDEYKSECSIKAYWRYYIAEKHTVANKNETIYEENYNKNI